MSDLRTFPTVCVSMTKTKQHYIYHNLQLSNESNLQQYFVSCVIICTDAVSVAVNRKVTPF